MDDFDRRYCHKTYEDDGLTSCYEDDCLDYMECEECPYYYEDDDWDY